MLYGEVIHQHLKLINEHVVADTIDYLEMRIAFQTDDWNGLEKWAHFARKGEVYDIRLTDNCICKEDHLNLSAGMWKVYLHGNEFHDGKVIQRVTTDEAVLYVIPTGTLNGEPFPEIPASVTEQILARLDNVEQNGGGGGGIAQETDPTVPAWAKQPKKPSYTADEVGALPASTKIPAKTSDITNDSGFITKAVADLTNYYTKSQTYTQAEVNALVSAIPKFAISVVASLPTTGISTTTVYLVKSGTSGDLYTEYIYVNGAWEILGNQRVDLTGYATEAWVNTKLSDYLPAAQLTAAINTALAQAKESGEFDGEPGKNGITPHIGANGNWYVGETDTGILARGKDGQPGQDGEPGANGTSVTVTDVQESTEDGGSNVVTFSDGKTLTVKNGNKGETGEKGDPGSDYVLTDADKQEIAGMIPGDSSGSSAGVVIISVLYTDGQATIMDSPAIYPDGANALDLLEAGQARMLVFTPPDNETEVAKKLGVLDLCFVDLYAGTLQFAGTITGKDGNEAVMAEFFLDTNEITIIPVVQNSAGSGGGGIVTITANDDGTYSSSHTPAEIAAMAETGAVVAVMENALGAHDAIPLYKYNDSAAVFKDIDIDNDIVEIKKFHMNTIAVMEDGVVVGVTTIGNMTGASASKNGDNGLVPKPSAGQQDYVLHGDGTWRAALSEEDKTDLVHRVIEKLPTWEGGTY